MPKIYSYGAEAPIEGLDSVREQMRLAHRYRNDLVSLEIKKRRRVSDAVRRVCPEMIGLDVAAAEREAWLIETRRAINRARAAVRKRVVIPDLSSFVAECSTELKVLWPRLKALKRATWTSEAWISEQARIDAWFWARKKRLYNAAGAPNRSTARRGNALVRLYWGTRLQVDDSMKKAHKGAPPKFRRWDGRGKIAVQLQGGLSTLDAFGDSPLLRLTRGDVTCPSRRSDLVRNGPRKGMPPLERPARKLGDATASLRIGSVGRAPVWCRVPIRLHRPLPPARIKWAWILVSRLGVHESWRFQVVLDDVPASTDRATSGAVGIDVGWRMIGAERRSTSVGEDWALDQGTASRDSLPERKLRVATWVGSDGDRGELSLATGWLDQMRKTRDIRSIRDLAFDAARVALSSRLATLPLPEWLAEATRTIGSWKAPARLASTALRWRGARFEGDGEAFDALEAWRKRDKHLLEYEANLRDQLQGQRLDVYRKFAASMRRRYGEIYVEGLDLRNFHENPKAEDDGGDGALKEHVRDACLSKLLGTLLESGAIEVRAAWTTKTCASCGHDNDWEDQSPLTLACADCKEAWDQDLNAARNLLRNGPASTRAVVP